MSHHRLPALARRLAAPCLGGALLAGPAAAAITGVCPDGSMFIVSKEADIPCRDSKQVEPQDMPPIRPHHLPRPYAWEVFQQGQDPNNPYNLVEQGRAVRESGHVPEGPDAAPPLSAEAPATPPGPQPAVSAAPPRAETLSLDAGEVRDLALIVELTEERVPARFEESAGGAPTLLVRWGHSPAFEARLHAAFASEDLGPVALFSAAASGPGEFHPNFTFVQDYAAFHPEAGNPRQIGVLEGSPGALAPGDRVLGYVVLPRDMDLGEPVDLYWNDRRISVVLAP